MAPKVASSQGCRPKLSFQAMPSKKGYTKPTSISVAMLWGWNLARSAMPPEMIAGIAAAKVSRKKNFTIS